MRITLTEVAQAALLVVATIAIISGEWSAAGFFILLAIFIEMKK